MTIRQLLLALPLLLVGWIAVLASVGLFTDTAPASVVLFPSEAFVSDLPADISILGGTKFSVTVASERQNLAYRLYKIGALIVLPAGLQGCTPSDQSLTQLPDA